MSLILEQVASGFNSATVIGVICICAVRRRFQNEDLRYKQLLQVLERYIEMELRTVRKDEKVFKELDVLRYMVNFVKQAELQTRSHSRETVQGRRDSTGTPRQLSPTRRVVPTTSRLSSPILDPPAPASASQKPSVGALINNPPAPMPALSQDATPRATSLSHRGYETLAREYPISPGANSPWDDRGGASNWSFPSTSTLLYTEPSHTDPTASTLPLGAEMDQWESAIEGLNLDWGDLGDDSTFNHLFSEPRDSWSASGSSDQTRRRDGDW